MKKLICAAVVAGSMFVMAEEPAKAPAAAPAAAAAKPAAEARPARPKITDEQRQKMREQREKFMAERKAAMEAKMLEVIRKYGLDDEKGKQLIKDLQEAMMSGRRSMARRPKPAGSPAVPKAPAPAPEKK